MRRFVYVECRDVSVPTNGGVMASFASVIVTAPDEDTAYAIGPAALQHQFDMQGDAWNHCAGAFLNDYVVQIPTDL